MSVRVKIECPASIINHQGSRQPLDGWWSAQRHFPVGVSELDLDEKTLAILQGEAKRGESPLKIVVASKPEKAR